jgi:hypothetical protein
MRVRRGRGLCCHLVPRQRTSGSSVGSVSSLPWRHFVEQLSGISQWPLHLPGRFLARSAELESAQGPAGSCEGLALLACFIMCAFKWRQRGHCCSFASGGRRIPVAGNKGREVQRSATRRVSALPLATPALSRPPDRASARCLVPWSCASGFAAGRAPLTLGAHDGRGGCYYEAGKQQPVERGGSRVGKALETLGAMLAFGWFDQNPTAGNKHATWPNKMLGLDPGFVI